MEVTIGKILWIVGGIIIAAFAIFTMINYAISSMQRADIAVFDINAYDDGVVYFTIKNTGTVAMTSVTINGRSATGTLPLEGGMESQFTATGLTGLTNGQQVTFTIVATFSNGQTKTLRVKAIVQKA